MLTQLRFYTFWISENKKEYRRVNTITNALFLSNVIFLNRKKKNVS